MKIVVVVPGYNEEKYIQKVLKEALKVTKNVLYVDDGSLDRSAALAAKQVKHMLTHSTNLGKGAALKTGCEYAFGRMAADAVVIMDADDQHSTKDLNLFFKELESGYKVVFGVRRFSPQMPLIRYLGNKFASIFLNLLFHSYIPDIPSGFKAFTKDAYKKILWEASGYEVETEIAARVAKHKIPYKIVEIQTIYHEADKGVNVLDALQIMRFLIQLRLGL